MRGAGYYYNDLDQEFSQKYGYSFWSPIFSFPDAWHPDPDNSDDSAINSLNFNGPFYSIPDFSINLGPMLMNIDSWLSEAEEEISVRDLFSSYPGIEENKGIFSDFTQSSTRLKDENRADPKGSEPSVWPNPFDRELKIGFILRNKSTVKLEIFDMQGRKTVYNENKLLPAGQHCLSWKPQNQKTGAYLCRLTSDEFNLHKLVFRVK